MNKKGRVWAEINLDACVNNFLEIKKMMGGKKILVAIKADAYGHGAQAIAKVLEKAGAFMFGVAGVEEGIALREKIRTPILILSPTPYNMIDYLFEYKLTPTITEENFALFLSKKARKKETSIKVHIEVDTGMGRTGIDLKDVLEFIDFVNSLKNLRIEGVFTHFPSADTDFEFTKEQIRNFIKLKETLETKGIKIPLYHSANSASIINFKESHLDMGRPGLSIYGIHPDGTQGKIKLQPVLSLYTRVVNLRNMEKGRSISYQRSYFLKKDSKIAVLSVGYGDGYPRSLSNKGYVLIWGRKAKIVGKICMDLTMVDVSHIPEVQIGDEVVLIGVSGREAITANDVARWANTIPYEITSLISPRVPRIYYPNSLLASSENSLILSKKYGQRV